MFPLLKLNGETTIALNNSQLQKHIAKLSKYSISGTLLLIPGKTKLQSINYMDMRMMSHVSNGHQMDQIDCAQEAMMGNFIYGISKLVNRNL